jgi:hypothetical protein
MKMLSWNVTNFFLIYIFVSFFLFGGGGCRSVGRCHYLLHNKMNQEAFGEEFWSSYPAFGATVPRVVRGWCAGLFATAPGKRVGMLLWNSSPPPLSLFVTCLFSRFFLSLCCRCFKEFASALSSSSFLCYLNWFSISPHFNFWFTFLFFSFLFFSFLFFSFLC